MENQQVHEFIPRSCFALDLGKPTELTALAFVQRVQLTPNASETDEYRVPYLHRYSLGTSYPAITAHVKELMERPELRSGSVKLVVDATGVGSPVIDLLRQSGLHPIEITITGGTQAGKDEGGGWSIPKRDLVSTVAVILQSRKLKIGPGTHRDTLDSELRNFKANPPTGNPQNYEAWREGDHDDLVFAVAMGCWWLMRPELKTYQFNRLTRKGNLPNKRQRF